MQVGKAPTEGFNFNTEILKKRVFIVFSNHSSGLISHLVLCVDAGLSSISSISSLTRSLLSILLALILGVLLAFVLGVLKSLFDLFHQTYEPHADGRGVRARCAGHSGVVDLYIEC